VEGLEKRFPNDSKVGASFLAAAYQERSNLPCRAEWQCFCGAGTALAALGWLVLSDKQPQPIPTTALTNNGQSRRQTPPAIRNRRKCVRFLFVPQANYAAF